MAEKLDPFRGFGKLSKPIRTVKDLRELLASYSGDIRVRFMFTDDFGEHPEQPQSPKYLTVAGRYDPGAIQSEEPTFLIVGKLEN